MGGRGHGTWARLYADVWFHAKTSKVAAALVALGVPERWSLDVAVGQLHRLACGLADTTDDGGIGHLTPHAFCDLIRWTDYRRAGAVHAAWMASGFIDGAGTPGARLHGFDEMFGELLRKRTDKHLSRERERRAKCRTKLGGSWAEVGRPTGAHVSPNNADVDLFESESETLPSVEPPNPPARDHPRKAGPDHLADAWAERCPDLAQPRRPLAPGLRAKLAAAWKREAGRDWPATFAEVATSDFLSGRKPGRDGAEPFRAALTWVIGPENLAKIDAGQYRNGGAARAPSRTATLANDAQAIYERARNGNAAFPEAIES